MGSVAVALTAITSTGDQSAGLPASIHSVGDMMEYGRRKSGGANGRFDPHIEDWINEGIARISNRISDYTALATFSISTVSGTAEYALDSAAFLYRRLADEAVTLDGDPIIPYLHHDWARFKKDNASLSGDGKIHFIVQSRQRPTGAISYIELFPVPTSVKTLAGLYVYQPGEISKDEETAIIPLPPQAWAALQSYVRWQAFEKKGRSIQDAQQASADFETVLNDTAHDMNQRGPGAVTRVERNNAPYGIKQDFNQLGRV